MIVIMNDEDVRRFRKRIKLLHRRLRQEPTKADGLSRTELVTLVVVARAGEVTPRGIAEELKMTSSNVAAALRSLESAGLVLRRKDSHDGRRVDVSATSAGLSLVDGLGRERDTWLGRAISTQLSAEEFDILIRAGELIERLSRFEPHPPPAQQQDP